MIYAYRALTVFLLNNFRILLYLFRKFLSDHFQLHLVFKLHILNLFYLFIVFKTYCLENHELSFLFINF